MGVINGAVLLLMLGSLLCGLALGFAIAWRWGYEQAEDDILTQREDRTIYSTEEQS